MAASINDQLKDMIRCCICTEVYSDPRMLSCIHTFCLRCLEQIQSNKKPGEQLPCPFCRKEFIIPDEGMNGIQKNFFMDNLIEMTKIANPPEKTSCGFCLVDSEIFDESFTETPLATSCCIDCNENLCDGCSMHHRKQKPTRNHQIVPLGTEVFPRQVATLKSCNQHSNEHLKMYCFDCKTTVCVICFAESHNSHKCTDIHKVADDFRRKIGQDAQKMSQLLSEGTTRMTNLEEVRTDVNRKVDTMEVQIRARAKHLKTLIDVHLLSQLEDLSKRKTNMLKKLEVDQNETKQHLSIVESFQSYCVEVSSKGSPGDVCASANDLHSRTDELQQLHQSSILAPVATFNCSYCRMELEDILGLRNNNILGCIKDNAAAVNNKPPGVKAMDAGNKVPLENAFGVKQHEQNGQRQPLLQPIPKKEVKSQQSYEPASQAINKPNVAFPKYWKHKNLNQLGDGSAYQRFQIDRGDQLYRELENMFASYYPRHAGNNPNQRHARDVFLRGYDARSRKISKIWCIENAHLYSKYAEKREAFCLNALVNTYHRLKGLLGSELATLNPDMALMNSTLFRHVNEYFLFQSATYETQELISRMGFGAAGARKKNQAGLGSRVAACSEENKFGSTSIHFKETLGIQDGIEDFNQKWGLYGNVADQSTRYVFVARVLLGNAYLCKEPRAFKRTPCMHRKCYSDSCGHHTLSGSYDSVIRIPKGGRESQNNGEYYDQHMNFTVVSVGEGLDERDFLIYSPEQSYPDFLIEYQ